MKLKRVNGIVLNAMLENAWNYLKIKEQEINKINVFPVPDGDTGSNMRMTLENGLKNTKPTNHAGEYLKNLSKGMLYGARGNSGVILSQLFYGLARELERDSIIDAYEFVQGFTTAYKYAYKAMVNPKEGTILTVTREGIENTKSSVSRGTYIDVFFSIYHANLEMSLINTPNLMLKLKEAGVVDSGGLGYTIIIEGILKYLQDDIITSTEQITLNEEHQNKEEITNLEFGYCTEFILHLIDGKESFNESNFINNLKSFGDSIACVKNDNDVKIHIHTKTPGDVINFAQRFGEFITFKIENMDLQHEETKEIKTEKDLGIIAVAQGDALKQTYLNLGCDIVIDGGMTMNTSTEEIIKAVKEINAKKYVVIVNNKNINLACEQAINSKELKDKNITIIKTINILEGYFVIASDDPTNTNIDYRIKNMIDSTHSLKTIECFKSNRSCTIDNVEIKENNYTSLSDDKILASTIDLKETIIDTLNKIEDIDSYSTCIILKGLNFNLDEDELIELINDKFDNLEITYLDGGQPLLEAIIGLI